MKKVLNFDTISEYNDFNNHETLHPLVSVIDFSKANPRSWGGEKNVRINYGLYCVFLKDVKCGDLKYGRNYYDYQEGTLVFVSPGQVMEIETDGQVYQPKGHALVFHPASFVNHQASRFNRHCHVCDHRLHQLEGSNRFAKLLPFLGVLAGRFKRRSRQTDRHSTDQWPGGIQCPHGNFKAFAFTTDTHALMHTHIVKNQFGGVGGTDSHLVFFFANRKTGGVTVDNKGC